jgi:hypothetical protein
MAAGTRERCRSYDLTASRPAAHSGSIRGTRASLRAWFSGRPCCPEAALKWIWTAVPPHSRRKTSAPCLTLFTVPNSLSATRPLGFASGMINSLDIERSQVIKSFVGFSDPLNRFAGDFFQVSKVTIAVTASTPVSSGHGFKFVSDPATTRVNFAQIGRERNGVFFS